MSRSSEAHSYLASDAIKDTLDALLQADGVLSFFDNEIEIIEQIEATAKRGLTQCQIWYMPKDRDSALKLAEVLESQGFIVQTYDYAISVSWYELLTYREIQQ